MKNKQVNISSLAYNKQLHKFKDNCPIFHIHLKCLNMLNKSYQRTTHFYLLKTIFIINMLAQIITFNII